MPPSFLPHSCEFVPRQYQLEATPETVHGRDSVVTAGTGKLCELFSHWVLTQWNFGVGFSAQTAAYASELNHFFLVCFLFKKAR